MSQTQGKGRIAVNNNTLIAFRRQLLNKLKEEKAKRDKEKQNNVKEIEEADLIQEKKTIPQAKYSINTDNQKDFSQNEYKEEDIDNNFALEQAYFANEGNTGYKDQTPLVEEIKEEEPQITVIDNEPEKKQRLAIKEDFQKGDIKRIAKENLNIIGNTFTQKVPEIATNIAEGISNVPVGIANEVVKSTGNKYNLDLKQARNPFEIKRGEEEHKPSFVERTVDNVKEAKAFAIDSINARNRNEQTNLDTGVHITGGAVKGLVDTAADATLSALSTLTPQEQKDFLVSNLQKLLQTKGGLYVQKLMNEYERDLNTLKELDPKKYRDYKTTFAFIEGAFDTVGLKQGKDIITKGSKGLIKDSIIDEKILSENVFPSLADAKNKINSGIENLGNKFGLQTAEGFNNYKGALDNNNKDLANVLKNASDDVTGKNIDGNTNSIHGSSDWYSKDADGYFPNGATEIDKNQALNAGIKDMMEKGEELGRGELYFYQSGNKSHFLPGEKIKDVTGPDLQHLENLQKIINKESTKEIVGTIPKEYLPDILPDGKTEIPLVLTKEYFKKIKSQHDKFNNFIPENFIVCVCEPKYVVKKFNGNIEDIAFLKELPHGNYIFTSGRYNKGNFEVTSHYEIFDEKIVEKYLESGELIIPKKKQIKIDDINLTSKEQVKNLYHSYRGNNNSKNFVISADEIKKLFSDYNPNISGSLQKESGILAQRFYEYSIKNEDYKNVVLTAGGPASGKTEIIPNTKYKSGNNFIIFDGTGKNFDTLVNNYNLAKQNGKKPIIEAIITDLVTAQKLSKKRNRTISITDLKNSHIKFRSTLQKIVDEKPEINLNIIYNTGKTNNGKQEVYNIPKKQLKDFLERLGDL